MKSIEFNFPIYRDGQEVRRLLWEKGNTVETVKEYKNVSWVGGEGEGEERVFTQAGTSSGLTRREQFTDARDVRKEQDDGTTLSDEDYKNLLVSRGTKPLMLSAIIKIPKIELNFWAWLARKIGNEMNHDMLKAIDETNDKLNSLSKRLDDHEDRDAKREAKRCRTQIVEFGDKLLDGSVHSKDHFDTIILACEDYEHYCKEHTDFRNGVTTDTIKAIHDEYLSRWKTHTFTD